MASARVTVTGHTIDPSQIQDPSEIPPSGAQFAGRSANGIVDVYTGTLAGDTDAQPSAKELLGTAVDTGALSNADYIYSNVSALYGGVDLPNFKSPSGNNVRSVAFVSGSNQGGYGAFHLNGKAQTEIALIPGFNSAVTQQWWQDSHQDWVNDNSQNDRSADGNGAGVMFLLFLNDFLGVPLDRILNAMPADNGAPLGKTYEALVKADSGLVNKAGRDGKAAFQAMISLLQNTQSPDGSLNLPADGNPFPSMPNAKRGGLFAAKPPVPVPATGSVAQDAQAAIGLESQIEQQLAALKAVLTQIPGDVTGSPTPAVLQARANLASKLAASKAAGPYKPNLPGSVVAHLDQEAGPFRAPQYDQSLQQDFWRHVYNELPGSGNHIDRLQVITGTNQAPVAVQITGTITSTAPQKDGDLHITLQPDNSNFPTNQSSAEAPLEVEIIYAGPISQPDAEQAAQGYKNPFDTKPLGTGVRIQAAGPLIFDRAHGRPAADGMNVEYGLEIHPVVALTVLGSGAPPPPQPPANGGQLSTDLTSALNQAVTLGQTLGNLTALLQKMQGEAPTS